MTDAGSGSDADRSEQRLTVLGDQIKELQGAIRDVLAGTQRSQQIGIALLATVLATAVARNQYMVLLVTPMALGLLIAYQAQALSDMMAMAWQHHRAKARLEEELGPTFPPDVGVTRHARANPSVTLANAGYLLLLYGLSIAGFWIIYAESLPGWTYGLYAASVLFGAGAATYSYLEQRSSWDRCEQLAANKEKGYGEQIELMRQTLGLPGRGWSSLSRLGVSVRRQFGRTRSEH